jgi:hypothetical protein
MSGKTDRESLAFRSGDAFFPERVRRFLGTFVYGSYQTPFYITYWSFMHALSGALFAGLCLRFPAALPNPYLYGFLVHTTWELWQVAIGMNHPYRIRGHNGLTDIVLDTAFFMAGMAVVLEGQKWLQPGPAAAKSGRE